ncbi:oligoendopeptidase F [Mycoplasmopsis agassizii]|uniref:Oligopeptidase F n=1 Tax=Mycoplasmopsis agassizii TaxID=33922 RepID=A0ABX4H6I0_9BACT|nr:oligoendopeptidase F [Mycoplasmopsis agassizii]PAF55506.1 oligoendopeptidase F [Mycoplasmopsis agassizii]SMC18013.1 oligopeptidase F. Metallo peptidase. MEROPS family M03B [Mycoplasmopsis agassizii]
MQYKKREDVPEKYKYDLSTILENKTIEDLFQELEKLQKDLLKERDTHLNSLDNLVEHYKLWDKWSILGERIYNYISNNLSVNVVDPEFNKLQQKFFISFYSFKEQWGDEEKRLLDKTDQLKEWIKDERLKNYAKSLEFTIKNKEYRLADSVEEYLNNTEFGKTNLSEIFSVLSNSELDYGFATNKDGSRKIKITLGNRSTLLEDEDEEIRRTTLLNYNHGYAKHRQTFARLLISHFKKVSSESLIRGFKSSVESYLFSDQIDERLVLNLYQSVEKNTPILQKYWKAYAEFFKSKYNKDLKMWDTLLPIAEVENKYTVEEAQELILKAMKPFGDEYISVLEKAFKERWIDYMPVENKRSGAYSIGGSYGLEKKYIMMNFNGKLREVKTLAHELGHSMHSYFSDKSLPYSLASYPIFLAEIASIFNELMLDYYLYENTDDIQTKLYLLSESINDFQGTVFRQVHFSNFEYDLYKLVDNRSPLAGFEDIQAIYKKLGEKYKLNDIEDPFPAEEQAIYSAIVPHYYYNFYVYKYAIGYIVANVFFNKFKNEGAQALQTYINNFLSKGGSKWPAEILKDAGVDLYDSAIYEKAFEILNDKVEKFIELGKKVYSK